MGNQCLMVNEPRILARSDSNITWSHPGENLGFTIQEWVIRAWTAVETGEDKNERRPFRELSTCLDAGEGGKSELKMLQL